MGKAKGMVVFGVACAVVLFIFVQKSQATGEWTWWADGRISDSMFYESGSYEQMQWDYGNNVAKFEQHNSDDKEYPYQDDWIH